MQLKWIRARRLRNESTDAERRLWCFLRREQLGGHKFRRQYPRLATSWISSACRRAW